MLERVPRRGQGAQRHAANCQFLAVVDGPMLELVSPPTGSKNLGACTHYQPQGTAQVVAVYVRFDDVSQPRSAALNQRYVPLRVSLRIHEHRFAIRADQVTP